MREGERMARINRAVELLADGQPVYTDGMAEPGYERGRAAAVSWADYLTIDLEHHPFEPAALRAFMRGLVDGGPTRSGHRTPAVVVTLPTSGVDELVIRANAWMIKQALAAGVHGLLLCHAEDPAAVMAFVEYTRYAFQPHGGGLGEGRRGAGGEAFAAEIWGLAKDDYLERADPWPLNKGGELMLGLKIENRRALEQCEESLAVPGIAFAEWGPGDMGMCFGHKDAHDPPYPPEMAAARARVKAACERAGVAFFDIVRPDDVTRQIDDGVRVGAATAEAAEIGRRHTARSLPW
jgi:4-hydroxy-2-oxoheptanedioate aldolase